MPPLCLIIEEKGIESLHDLLLTGKDLISDKDNRKLTSFKAKPFFDSGKGFIERGISNVISFDFKGREHWLERGKITLEDDLAGLAILGIEKIEIDSIDGLGRGCRLSRDRRDINS